MKIIESQLIEDAKKRLKNIKISLKNHKKLDVRKDNYENYMEFLNF